VSSVELCWASAHVRVSIQVEYTFPYITGAWRTRPCLSYADRWKTGKVGWCLDERRSRPGVKFSSAMDLTSHLGAGSPAHKAQAAKCD
jgi:hypothetical protein